MYGESYFLTHEYCMFTDVRTPVTNSLTQHLFIDKHIQLHVLVTFSLPQAVYTNTVKCVFKGTRAKRNTYLAEKFRVPII